MALHGHGSRRNPSEIAPGTFEQLGEVVNRNEFSEERAPQQMKISRIKTSEIQQAVKFESLRDYWESLPVVSKLFMLMIFVDVCMVFGYGCWQLIEMSDNERGEIEHAKTREHLHVVLGMLVTAVFLVVFVLEAIAQENDFELVACLLLTTVIAVRVVYFVFKAHYGTWGRVVAIVIVSAAGLVTMVLGILTYNRFGWRVYSRLACDLRLKHAAERTVMYFVQNRFHTLLKLDFQFLMLTGIMGLVMSVQASDSDSDSDDLSFDNNKNTRILLFCTVVGFLIGFPWGLGALYAVRNENPRLACFLGWTCGLTFALPITAILAIYTDEDKGKRKANESLAISTTLFIIIRLAVAVVFQSWSHVWTLCVVEVWYYMARLMTLSAVKHDDPQGNSDFHIKFRTSNKNPDLLPLMKGAWLIKPSGVAQNKRRFFQLSQDYTTLRWAWNRYVLLYYVDDLETDDVMRTITLHFEVEQALTVKFETQNEYDTWKTGFEVLLAILMAPGDELDNRSRVALDQNAQKRKRDSIVQGLTIEGFLNKLGVTMTRKHPHTSQHPLREAEKEIKQKLGSRHNSANTGKQMPEKIATIDESGDRMNRQSSRIPSAKNVPNAELATEPSLDYLHGEGSGGSDSRNTSQSSDQNAADTNQGTLGLMHVYVDTIDISELDIGKFLGSGAEGYVKAAWYLDTPVAVKYNSSTHEQEMTRCTGQHDNVVGLRCLAKNGADTCLVLEYCPRGTLDVLLHHTMNTRWEPSKTLQLIRCIARGLLHLHSRKPAILHRDIKPANVFVSHGLVLKIGDFGMSKQLKPPTENQIQAGRTKLHRSLTQNVIGTAPYSAPELLDDRLQKEEFDVDRILKADVYSFGVTMWEIVQRVRPFEGMAYYEIMAGWSSSPDSMQLEPFDIPRDLNPAGQHLMKFLQELTTECTDMNPDRRPDMRTVVRRLRDMNLEAQRIAGEGTAP